MSISKPSLPQGTRDFGPEDMSRRNYIFKTLQDVFQEFGFQQIETPAMEQLKTLTGKYGDEGDQLIFKILNSGDFLSKTTILQNPGQGSKDLLPQISERALRYDLTVPFARFVVMNQNEIGFPFKRFQIQPVWRADRPQKGRYREFFQCDADVVGSPSLLNEAELMSVYDKAFSKLGIKNVTIRINNRKILAAIAEIAGKPSEMGVLVTAIDKLDKIGAEGVEKELLEKGFSQAEIARVNPFWNMTGSTEEKLSRLKILFKNSETGIKGIEELETVLDYYKKGPSYGISVEITISLARGLNYYTGTIFEVVAEHGNGSIGGGGRYDDLTGVFGLKGITGVGISFGADRIFDLMKDQELFPSSSMTRPALLICNFFEPAQHICYSLAQKIRAHGISVELYPDLTKLPKQLKYADHKKIEATVLVGETEFNSGLFTLKNMVSGTQESMSEAELLSYFKQKA